MKPLNHHVVMHVYLLSSGSLIGSSETKTVDVTLFIHGNKK